MACIHYKFKNSLDFDSITFDGLHISVRDLKESIMQRKKLSDTDMDLLIINALNAKAYKDEDEMIPKNASVIVARIPLSDAPKSRGPKTLKAYVEDPKPQPQVQMPDPIINKDNLAEVADLVTAKGSEEDKIKAMMRQSTKDFDPSNYMKKYPTGTPSPSYVCFKCNKTGHFIQNCPNAAAVSTADGGGSPNTTEVVDMRRIKRPTGIPHTFLTTTNKTEPGAMSLGDGRFAVPTIDQEAFKKGKKERPPFLPALVVEKQAEVQIPSELKCLLCKDLLTDAVVIPCCGNSYCDECIRNHLVEDEDHKCPTCHEENVSPDKLIINISLRRSVNNFKNETLYQKPPKQLSPPPPPPPRTTLSTTKIEQPLKLDTSIKPIDLTDEPPTPVQDEQKPADDTTKTENDVPKGIAVLHGRLPVSTDSGKTPSTSTTTETSSSNSSSFRPSVTKSTSSTDIYISAPIPSLGVGGYRPPIPPVSLPNTALPPPGYRPPMLYPPGLVPPLSSFPVPPGFIPPQVKPLSEHEFYRAKQKLLGKPNPLDDYTRPVRDRETKRSRSRSKSPRKHRTKSRSRSRTPKDGSRKKTFSRSPSPKKRSYTKSRSRSPFRKKKSYSRSRTRSPRRSRSRLRSRSFTPRSRSWTPKKFRGRSRSFTRSRSRSRSRVRRRTYSRSPPPRRRSFSRSLTPRRRSFSRSPRRRSKSPFYRGRGRSPYSGYGREWSPPSYRGYSPTRRGYSPGRYGSGPPPFNYGGRDDGRFDQRIYEEIFQDYLARFGLPPPPPPPSGHLERGMYYDPRKGIYRGGSRSRSRSPRSKRDRNKDRKNDNSSRGKDKKTTDKSKSKTKKEEDKNKSKKEQEKSKKEEEKSKDSKSKGKDEKVKDKENKHKKSDDKGEEKAEKKDTEHKPGEKKVVKKVVKAKSKEDGTAVKKESIALRLKTKAGLPKSPLKGKPKAAKTEGDSTLQAINRTGALKTISTTDVNVAPVKESMHAKRKNSNLIEINTQQALPEVKDDEKSTENIKDNDKGKTDPMETDEAMQTGPVEKEGVEKEDNLEEIKNVATSVKQVESKKIGSPKKVKVTKKIKKVKKLVDVDASQSDSASDLEKAKAKKKKRVAEINENDENSQDESPAKRLKPDEEVEKTEMKVEAKDEDQLMLSPPELSKWERDDYNEDKSPDLRDKLKKRTEKKPLPRSVIESAEKAITQKQPKPAVVASAIVPANLPKKVSVHDRLQKSPVRQTEVNNKKSPDIDKKSPVRQPRRVYMDKEKQGHNQREEEENRRVHKRESSMQITISSDKNKIEKDIDIDRKFKSDKVSEFDKSERPSKQDKRKISLDEKLDKVSKHKMSERNGSQEKDVRKKITVSKEKVKEKDNVNKEENRENKKSDKSNGDVIDKEKKSENLDEKNKTETENQVVKKKKYERKESIVDESKFVPDYNEHSDSEVESEGGASSASQVGEKEAESDDEKDEKKHKKHKKEKKHKKNKKHKHKHKKKKHKKHKEGKESDDKGE